MDTERNVPGWRETLHRNALALISLVVALTALGYNTWRNESTERHRNVRQAAFAMLQNLGELQQLADTRFYGGDHDETNRIAVWGRVSLLRDLGDLVSPEADARAEALHRTWSEQAGAFDQGDAAAEEALSKAIAAARAEVLVELKALR